MKSNLTETEIETEIAGIGVNTRPGVLARMILTYTQRTDVFTLRALKSWNIQNNYFRQKEFSK